MQSIRSSLPYLIGQLALLPSCCWNGTKTSSCPGSHPTPHRLSDWIMNGGRRRDLPHLQHHHHHHRHLCRG
ncbi:hypothetical protein AAFF_G00143150 [Aldrovandia affinis]|uniref:Uncharacterized protein n=1 Tax=Aldrovandia affinis TaxID=143900 RepID=A0AAD7WWZ2_9TELE|nr:hypothetical protein AAFF_G00143150 [Aldrovandia affinis]